MIEKGAGMIEKGAGMTEIGAGMTNTCHPGRRPGVHVVLPWGMDPGSEAGMTEKRGRDERDRGRDAKIPVTPGEDPGSIF
jgi:hypothetical protein